MKVVLLAVLGGGVMLATAHLSKGVTPRQAEAAERTAQEAPYFRPSDAQWASLALEPAGMQRFEAVLSTDGKIAVDEDRTTPIFSPYAGRVAKLYARAGERIEQGQPLFAIEATDMVQGQNDYFSASAGLNKARSQLHLAEINFKRYKDLYQANAAALKEYQQAEANLAGAQSDFKAAEAAFDAARNRLRILGKTEADITGFENSGSISSETVIPSPLTGTVVQRKIGPGQFVNNSSGEPVFVIGDLSSLWVLANVRESDAVKVRVGQQMDFTILAVPDRVFTSKVTYVSPAVDPNTRRLQVRAEIANPDGILRPEMFANVRIVTSSEGPSTAVPKDAVIGEGDSARIWVAREDHSLEVRRVKTGLVNGGWVQVTDGLSPGERVVTRGSLFIDRLVTGSVD